MSEVIRDASEIKSWIESFKACTKTNAFFRVQTPIFSQNDRPIHSGNIFHTSSSDFDKFRLYVSRNDIVFYRVVKRWTDVVSYNENTISLTLGLFHFLHDYDIRLVFTYAADEQKLVLTPTTSFAFESCLSAKIGYLRRAKLEGSIVFESEPVINLNNYAFLRTLHAEKREHVKGLQTMKKQKKEEDSTQRGLFG